MQVNRSNASQVRAALEAGLVKLGEEMGVHLSLGHRGTADAGNIEWKLTVSQIGEDGVAETPELSALKRFRPDLVGAILRGGNNTGALNVVGYNPRAPKMPVIATSQSGESYKVPIKNIENRIVGFVGGADKEIEKPKPVERGDAYGAF